MDENRMGEYIREAVCKKAEQVSPGDDLFFKIQAGIAREKNKEAGFMKSKKIKLLLVTGILCIASISVYATGKITSTIGHSSQVEEKFPTVSEVQKQAGFAPKFVEEFSNGFVFGSYSVGEIQDKDADGNVVRGGKQITLFYKQKGAADTKKIMSLDITDKEDEEPAEMVYDKQNYLFLPPDVSPSEEDRALNEAGKLEISYGSSKEERSVIQSVSWKENGLRYVLLTIDYDNLTQDDMEKMAAEIQAQ